MADAPRDPRLARPALDLGGRRFPAPGPPALLRPTHAPAARTRERMPVRGIETASLPRKDVRRGSSRLTGLAIGAIGLYALAALVLLPEGDPPSIARLLLGVLIPSAAVVGLLAVRAAPAWAIG